MECAICSDKVNEPKVISCCALILCEPCYIADYQMDGKCPLCRKDFHLLEKMNGGDIEEDSENNEELKPFDSSFIMEEVANYKKIVENYNIQMKNYRDMVKRTKELTRLGYKNDRTLYEPVYILPEFSAIRALNKGEIDDVLGRIPDHYWDKSPGRIPWDDTVDIDQLLQVLVKYNVITQESIETILDVRRNPFKWVRYVSYDGGKFPFVSFDHMNQTLIEKNIIKIPLNINYVFNYSPKYKLEYDETSFESSISCWIKYQEANRHPNRKFSYKIINLDGLKLVLDEYGSIDLETKLYTRVYGHLSLGFDYMIGQFVAEVSADDEYGSWERIMMVSLLTGNEFTSDRGYKVKTCKSGTLFHFENIIVYSDGHKISMWKFMF